MQELPQYAHTRGFLFENIGLFDHFYHIKHPVFIDNYTI